MKVLVAFIGVLSLAVGAFCFFNAQSAVHEILGAILVLGFVVSVIGLAVLERLEQILAKLEPAKPPAPKPRSGFINQTSPIAFAGQPASASDPSSDESVETMRRALKAGGGRVE